MPPIAALHGVVASPHYLASLAGLEVLKKGGNAVDAAAATNAALTVVFPHMCSAGGDGFWLIYSAKEEKVYGLNATGRSPRAATIDFFREKGMKSIPVRGLLPVTVPGAVDGWEKALERFGSMSLRDVLSPAIRFAGEGFPISEGLAAAIAKHLPLLRQFRTTAKAFLRNGKPLKAGEVLMLSDLARTLSLIGEGGAQVFYRGEIADEIASYCENNGGLISKDDLADHKSDWVEPLSTSYRGNTVYAFPPNSQGIVTLLELNLVENFDIRSMRHLSSDSIHVMIEAKKIAFKDREMISDPDFVSVPVKELLSKRRAGDLTKSIRMSRAAKVRAPGGGGDTIFLATADESGNVVSLIQSLYYPFGSGVVAGSTGVLLQNRGAYFSLNPKHPNKLEPRKRTLHTLSPIMILRDGRPFLALGNMGRDGQPQFNLQIITNVIDFGLNIQEAIEAPRWLSGRAALEDPPDLLTVEKRIPESVLTKLKKKGHKLKIVDEWSEIMGHAQGIQFSYGGGKRVMTGGADPRADGLAVGW